MMRASQTHLSGARIMLNRRLAFSLFLVGLAAAGSVQAWSWTLGSGEKVKGSGEIVSESRDLGGFDGISLAGGFKVLVRQGTTPKLELKADRNLLALIETRVVEGSKGRTLEIAPKRGYNLSPSATPQITLEMAQLRAISIGGSGEVRVEAMKTPGVDASIAGSGDIRFVDLNSESLALKVAGSGDVVAAGRTGSLTVSVAGSGDVRTKELTADEVKVNIAGSGDVEVYAAKTLKVSIAGSGGVGYLGAPQISSSVAGSGSIKKLQN
jgi:hypothetical protein